MALTAGKVIYWAEEMPRPPTTPHPPTYLFGYILVLICRRHGRDRSDGLICGRRHGFDIDRRNGQFSAADMALTLTEGRVTFRPQTGACNRNASNMSIEIYTRSLGYIEYIVWSIVVSC